MLEPVCHARRRKTLLIHLCAYSWHDDATTTCMNFLQVHSVIWFSSVITTNASAQLVSTTKMNDGMCWRKGIISRQEVANSSNIGDSTSEGLKVKVTKIQIRSIFILGMRARFVAGGAMMPPPSRNRVKSQLFNSLKSQSHYMEMKIWIPLKTFLS